MVRHVETYLLFYATKQNHKNILTHILVYGIIISTRRKQTNGGT